MNATSVRKLQIRTDPSGMLMDGVDFKAWFGKSRAVDAGRAPVLVFRGEHGEADIPLVGAHSRRGALSFGSLAAANVYAVDPNDPLHDQTAAAPRVVPAFLRIERPLIDTPEDPFLELSVLRQALGPAQCRRIAAKFADAIADTGNWDEHFAPRFPSVAAFLEQASDDDLDELYFYAYRLMDDPQEVELLRQAGFDGAIHGGAGSNALEPEYKVFSSEQVLPAIAAGWPLRPEPRREAPRLTPDGQQPSTVTRVRQAIAQLVGTGVSELREGLGRFVVTTSQEVVGQPLLARSAGVLRSAGGTSAFQQMLLERQAACDRAIKAIGAVDDCAIVRHEGGQRWMMILRDASSPGNWRTQSFDAVGFSGHMTFTTKALAIEAAAQAKYTVRDDGALDRLQDTPEFQRGLFVTDVTRLWNLGEITFEEAQQRVAAYDETTAVLQSMALQSAKAFYAPASGTMYMLADRIAQGAEKSVFLHEVVHKHGRKTLGTHGWSRMVGAVKRWEQAPAGSIERVIHFAAHARAAGAVGLADVDLYEEELFAYAVEEAVSRGVKPSAEAAEGSAENWLADVTATLRGVVMQLTSADPPPLEAQELVDLAYALAQLENPARSQELLRELGPELAGQVRQLAARAGRPVWYSALKAEVDALPARAQTPAHWLRWIAGLKRRGVSPSEIEWSGITNWLAAVTGPVSPAQMSAFLGANGVQLQEVLKGGTHTQRKADRIRVELDALGYSISDGNSPLLTRRSDGAVFSETAGAFRRAVDKKAPASAEQALDPQIEAMALAFAGAYGETINEDGTRYSDLTVPGGEHYSELLITLPVRRDVAYTRENVRPLTAGDIVARPDLFWYFEVPGNVLQIPKAKYADQEAALQYILAEKQPEPDLDRNYKSSHWSELNIVGHVRFNERKDVDGRRVLFIEEVQCDWAADGKRSGFNRGVDPAHTLPEEYRRWQSEHGLALGSADEHLSDPTLSAEQRVWLADFSRRWEEQVFAPGSVPDAPFVGTTDAWVGLILKRMVRYAVDHGIERVAFITGEQSVQRYGLAQELTSVAWTRTPDGRYNIEGNTGYEPIVRKGLDVAALTKLLGAETAARVEQGEGTYLNDPITPINGRVRGAFDTPGLTVGGYGMRVFYDTMLPRIARHVVRKLGGAGTRKLRVPFMVGIAEEADRLGMSIADMMDLADPQDYAADLVGFEINQAMRDASSNGLPLFSLATFRTVAAFGQAREDAVEEAQRQCAHVISTHMATSGWLRAPNGEPTRLTKEQWVLVRTENFKHWFGDWEAGGSAPEVLDPVTGEPRVLHHGTHESFTAFDPALSRHFGFHVGEREQAEVFGQEPLKLFASLKRPIRLPDLGTWEFELVARELRRMGLITREEYEQAWTQADQAGALREVLLAKGYDGIVYLNRAEGFDGIGREDGISQARSDAEFLAVIPEAKDSLILFRPNQLKSATANRGTFDGRADDLRFSHGWSTAAEGAGPEEPNDEPPPGGPRGPGGRGRRRDVATQRMAEQLQAAARVDGVSIQINPLRPDQHATEIFEHNGPQFWLAWIESTVKGAGARAIAALCTAADERNAVLRLCVEDNGSGKLATYYERFGFRRDPAGGNNMERPVEGGPREAPAPSRQGPEGAFVVYHGTVGPWAPAKEGITCFASSPTEAKRYAPADEPGAQVFRCLIKLENPLVVHTDLQPAEEWDARGALHLEQALALGHDGVITRQSSTGASNFMALRADQVLEAVALPSPGGLASFMRTSRMKDATGEPIRFFHGTANAKGQAPFQIYKNVETDRFQMYLPPGQARGGFYFSPMRSLAQGYAREAALPDREPRILEVFLNITNPYLASEDEFGFYVTQTDIERLEAAGYDGVVKMAPWSEGRLEQAFQVVAFRPEQIKSATENNGQFDPANPDIRFSMAPVMPSAFQTWFGESEVVDEQGDPLVVFHGTTEDFSVFDGEMLGSSTDHPSARMGFFFSSSPDVAALFAGETWTGWPLARGFQSGANVMPVFLSITNPAAITAREFIERFVRGGEDVNDFQQKNYLKGHDGLRILADTVLAAAMDGDEYSADTWVALRADQIKSAIGNTGNFDRRLQDIRFSLASGAPRAAPAMAAGGDGWMRDARGAPLVVYHGTPEGGFAEFNAERGVFFTSSAELAAQYTVRRGGWLSPGKAPAVYPAHLRMTNPLEIDALGKRHDNIPVPWAQWKPKVFGNLPAGAVSVQAALDWAREHGHDGLIARNVVDTVSPDGKRKSDVFAVLRPDQITSAIGGPSVGKDPVTQGIRYSLATVSHQPGRPWTPVPTTTRAFREWFRRSPLVDDDGEPVVLYHGTTADLTRFEPPEDRRTDHGWYGLGVGYFTADQSAASAYAVYRDMDSGLGFEPIRAGSSNAGANVVPVYVALQNPYVWPEGRVAAKSRAEAQALTDELVAAGYDGVVVPNKYAGGDAARFFEVVAFHPGQIKSAIGNAGQFDRFTADIRFSLASNSAPAAPAMTSGSDGWLRDGRGEPLVVYHGTTRDFAQFDAAATPKSLTVSDGNFYFSGSPDTANWFAGDGKKEGGIVMPVHLRMRNPMRVSAGQADSPYRRKKLGEKARALGHDGLIIEKTFDRNARNLSELVGFSRPKDTVYVAFESTQIRSAFHRPERDPRPAITADAFAIWFRDSKVVDRRGNPQVVYHGTLADISEFRPSFDDAALPGVYFTTDPRYASQYAGTSSSRWTQAEGGNVLPAYLAISNPMEVPHDEYWDAIRSDDEGGLIRKAISAGHDGMVVRAFMDNLGPADMWVALRPEQVKSAIGNNGQFDRSSPDIRFSLATVSPAATGGQVEAPSVSRVAANFSKWFGGSRVLDGRGRPLVVYHGTNASKPLGVFSGTAYAGWFSEVPSKASAYTSSSMGDGAANGAIYPVYLAIKRPLDLSLINADDKFDANVLARLMGVDSLELQTAFDEEATGPAYWNLIDTARFREWAQSLGKDGIKIMEGTAITWAAISPEQVKSAIGNNGEFDQTNPDIRFSLASPAQTSGLSTWLESSKVVDYLGNPRVLYHGTNADFSQFRPTERGFFGGGIYATDDASAASEYAGDDDGANVMPIYVRMVNPYKYEGGSFKGEDAAKDLIRELFGDRWRSVWETFQQHAGLTTELQDELEQRGHDGLEIRLLGEPAEYVAFRPEQIRSALGHSGQFDASAADIRFSRSGAPLAWVDHTVNPAFQHWFFGSVVTRDGQPEVVFHGTSGPEFNEFRPSADGVFGPGIYFTSDTVTASGYSDRNEDGGRLVPAYLSIRNPLRVTADYDAGHALDFDTPAVPMLRDLFGQEADWVIDALKERDTGLGSFVVGRIKARGHDGLIIDWGGGKRDYVVYEPHQVKSALGNNGEFDGTNPDIRFSLAAVAPALDTVSPQLDMPHGGAFNQWFGGSKVVNAQGEPLRVYHGTPATGLTVFDSNRIGVNGRAEGAGFYFTTDRKTAEGYGQRGETLEVYLGIKKPLAYDTKPFNQAQVRKLLTEVTKAEAEDTSSEWRDGFLANYVDTYSKSMDTAVREAARAFEGEQTALDQVSGIVGSGVDADTVNIGLTRALGYDGYFSRGFSGEEKGGGDIWVAMRSEQVKSATGNQGTFDLQNPDIRFTRSAAPGRDDWSRKSKAVDDAGKLLTLFHGTAIPGLTIGTPPGLLPAGAFTQFSKDLLGEVTDSSDAKSGFWFTADEDRALAAAADARAVRGDAHSAYVYRVNLRLENPLVVSSIAGYLPGEVAKIAKRARARGRDGIIFLKGEGGGTDYLVFEPDQIRMLDRPQAVSRLRASEPAPLDAWIAGTKVVDQAGQPRVMYHGTIVWERDGRQLGDILSFDRLASVKIVGRRATIDTIGNWFSSEADDRGAGMYAADGAVYPVYLRITSPLVTTFGDLQARARRLAKLPADAQVDGPAVERLRAWMKKAGYDGVRLVHDVASNSTEFEHQDCWITLEPEQIRSAIGEAQFLRPERAAPVMYSLAASANAVPGPRPTWYSALGAALERCDVSALRASGWLGKLQAWINKGVVSESEVEWSGIRGWLSLQGGPIPSSALVAYQQRHGVRVLEVIKDGQAVSRKIDQLVVALDALGYTVVRDYEDEVATVHHRATQVEYSWDEEERRFQDIEGSSILDSRVTQLALELGDLHDEGDSMLADPVAPQYAKQTLAGGENYKEVLITLDRSSVQRRVSFDDGTFYEQADGRWTETPDGLRGELAFGNEQQLREAMGDDAEFARQVAQPNDYVSSHWAERDVLVHFRTNERFDADGGGRVLFIEEVQSDWAQEGRRVGFVGSRPTPSEMEAAAIRAHYEKLRAARPQLLEPTDVLDAMSLSMGIVGLRDAFREAGLPGEESAKYHPNNGRIPNGPFVMNTDAWVSLALKRIIRLAVDSGCERVAFINGTQSAYRYDLRHEIASIVWSVHENSSLDDEMTFTLSARHPEGDRVEGEINYRIFRLSEFEPMLGKAIADQVKAAVAAGERTGEFSELELVIGGEGMVSFYDQVLPAAANKLLARFGGGRLGPSKVILPSDDFAPAGYVGKADGQVGFVITPALRDAATRGFPLFGHQSGPTEPGGLEKWNQGNQIVDAAGMPLVVYHGTARSFTKFSPKLKGAKTKALDAKLGFFFAENPRAAEMFTWEAGEQAGGNIMPVHIRMLNPVLVRDLVLDGSTGTRVGHLMAQAKRAGHDGVIFENSNMLGHLGRSFAVFEPEQIKSAIGNRGTFSLRNADIRFSLAAPAPRAMAMPPAFESWFADSKVCDPAGRPLPVYHGTTNSFDAFDPARANPDADLGAGFYFSSTPEDVAINYAGEGPDLTHRIEDLANEILNEEDLEVEEAFQVARERLSEGAPNVIRAYLAIRRPVIIGGPGETFFDRTDPEADDWEPGAAVGLLVDFEAALVEVLADDRWIDAKPEIVLSDILERSLDFGIGAAELIECVKSSRGLMYAIDALGRPGFACGEILRRTFEKMGYDGFIDRTVDRKFGSQSRNRPAMGGMDPDTVHYIAFRPQQIKSAVGNRGTFDPSTPDIRYSLAAPRRRTPEWAKRPRDLEFDGWFRGSVVRSPLFHKTSSRFDRFDTTRGDLGAHFGTLEQIGKLGERAGNAGQNVMPVWLSIKNPLRLTDMGSFHADGIALQLERKGLLARGEGRRITKLCDENWQLRKEFDPVVRQAIVNAGYDGVVYRNQHEGGGDSYIALDPDQIRFALTPAPRPSATPEFLQWVAGTRVVDDQRQPLMVFRGCAAGSDGVPGAPNGGKGGLLWASSSRDQAAFFADGEIQNLYLKLTHPLVVREADRRGRSHAFIVAQTLAQVRSGVATWDGVIFPDTVDGMGVGDVFAVFPVAGRLDHAVRHVGRTVFDEESGSPSYEGEQPAADPARFTARPWFDEQEAVPHQVAALEQLRYSLSLPSPGFDGSPDRPHDLAADPRFHDFFFGRATSAQVRELASWLRGRPNDFIRLYHGTAAANPVWEKGLLPASATRRNSYQSASGYVCASVYPGLARDFGAMAAASRGRDADGYRIAVYPVVTTIRQLRADLDQLANQRSVGLDVGNSLAESLIYGHGARLRGRVDPACLRAPIRFRELSGVTEQPAPAQTRERVRERA